MDSPKMSVLLATEGTYPFYQGGVSTWCDMLASRLDDVDFTILSVLTDPFLAQKYKLPDNAKLIRIPLWGTDEPSEHLEVPFSSTYMAKQRTSLSVIQDKFLPLFDVFIGEILSKNKNSQRMGSTVLQLYEFFREFDYKRVFKSHLVWERYKVLVKEEVANPTSGLDEPDVHSLIQSLGWLYRFFNVVNTNVPVTTVTHSSAAAFCGIPCVISKLKYGTPFILTEHGVYLREQYLSLSKRGYSSFLNTFLIRMIWSVIRLNYDFADQISPVCEYNTRWEKRITDRHDRIRVIYNGVDPGLYTRVQPKERDRPTVVTVARIDPVKDLMTLIRTANVVREKIRDVVFLVYGGVSVPEYYEDCLKLIEELSLESTVKLLGHTTDMVSAYESGDVVLQTSISEAFPYSVIEAMLSGKPVIATAVGGVSEAIGNTGMLLTPGDVSGLATGVVQLLENPSACLELGEEARRRALSLFTIEEMLNGYMRSYIRLSVIDSSVSISRRQPVRTANPSAVHCRTSSSNRPESMAKVRQTEGRLQRRLAMERALALLVAGYPSVAVTHLNQSIRHASPHVSDVAKLALLSKVYGHLGDQEEVWNSKFQLLEVSKRVNSAHQRLLAEKGFAFKALSMHDEAIRYFKWAIRADSDSNSVPIFLQEVSRILTVQGKIEQAGKYHEQASLMLNEDDKRFDRGKSNIGEREEVDESGGYQERI